MDKYNKIINPITNRKVNINSTLGKKIINIYVQEGGIFGWSKKEKEKKLAEKQLREKMWADKVKNEKYQNSIKYFRSFGDYLARISDNRNIYNLSTYSKETGTGPKDRQYYYFVVFLFYRSILFMDL